MGLIADIKQGNKKLLIYAFQCIMRCPSHSASDEEPDYYENCGAEIHMIGNVRHRISLGLCDEAELAPLHAKAPQEHLDDFLNRRAFNLQFNLKALELLHDEVIDFLIIPQDDSAPMASQRWTSTWYAPALQSCVWAPVYWCIPVRMSWV